MISLGETRICLFNFVDRNQVGITLLFRVQRDPIPTRCDKRSQTFKHAPTLLKLTENCNRFTHEVIQKQLEDKGSDVFLIVVDINLSLAKTTDAACLWSTCFRRLPRNRGSAEKHKRS